MRYVLFAFITLLAASEATACSCMPDDSIEKTFSRAQAVFVGTAKTIQQRDMQNHVTFTVTKNYKAVLKQELTLTTHVHGATCGYSFKAGETYLVFANKRDGTYTTGLCSGNKPTNRAEEDLQTLDNLLAMEK